LRSSHAKIAIVIAAVISELCPETTHSTAAGDSMTASSSCGSPKFRCATAKKSAPPQKVQSSNACK